MVVRHRASPNNAAATRFGLELVLPVSRLNCKPAHSGFGNMSFSAFRWAVTQTAPTQSKLILILLANRANDVGQCWPAYKTLAIESGMSRRSVIRSITKLEELGLIRSSHRFKNNENTSNSYTLIMGQVSKPKAVGSGDSMALPSDCVSLPSDW